MTPTADITYRNMAWSDWLDTQIQRRAAKLSTFCPDILSCKVLVEVPHRHHEQGNRFHVRIDITVPGERIIAGQAWPLSPGQFRPPAWYRLDDVVCRG